MKSEESRFIMTKKHHSETYKKAKKEGKMDLEFIPLCESIDKTKEYFTASCCAGRITLVGLNKKESKKESAFHRKWHRKIKINELMEGINSFEGEVLWLKQEPLIFHIGTNNLDNANKIMKACQLAGIKRRGIHVAKNGKFLIEVLGSHAITIPIKEDGFLVREKELEYFLKKCNQKFEKNQKHLKSLTTEIKKVIK